MKNVGVEELARQLMNVGQCQELQAEDMRIGFHCPPFISVNHMHLHILYPVSKMEFYYKNYHYQYSNRFHSVS